MRLGRIQTPHRPPCKISNVIQASLFRTALSNKLLGFEKANIAIFSLSLDLNKIPFLSILNY